MSEQELRFVCTYCHKETTIIVQVSKPSATRRKETVVVRDCEHCHRPNKLEVRDNIDVLPLILGKDRGFIVTPTPLASPTP